METDRSFWCSNCNKQMIDDCKLIYYKSIEVRKDPYSGKRNDSKLSLVYLHCKCGEKNGIKDLTLKSILCEVKKANKGKYKKGKRPKVRQPGEKSFQHGVAKEIQKADESIERWNKLNKDTVYNRLPGSYGSRK